MYKRKRTYKRKIVRRSSPGTLRCIKWSNRDAANLCHNTNVGSDTVTEVTGTASFQLSDIQDFGSLVANFDQFRLVKVYYRWVITRDTDWASTTTNRGFPVRIMWCHDFNDSTPLSSTEMIQRSGVREIYMNGDDKPATRWYPLNPAMLIVGYETALASAYLPTWRKWVDTASSAMPYYGLKWWASNLYAGINLRLEVKEVYEFKGMI